MTTIRFTHGTRQTFRRRTDIITIRGEADALAPPSTRCAYRLNGGQPQPFHVEDLPDDGIDRLNGYKPVQTNWN